MNDQSSFTPPPIPTSSGFARPAELPLGADPAEQIPIAGVVGAIECVLRQPRRVIHQLRQPGAGYLMIALLFIAVLCSLIYGAIVGTFSGGTQLWAAPTKVAVGLLLSAFICLPSLYIFTCLSGAQVRLLEVLGLLAGLLALTSVLLVGFAPVAWVFSQSTASVAALGALHLVFALISVGFGLRFLSAAFRHLNARSHSGLGVWMIIFLLVLLQMTTALRPIVGTADTLLPTEKRFFLKHWTECLKSPPSETNDSLPQATR